MSKLGRKRRTTEERIAAKRDRSERGQAWYDLQKALEDGSLKFDMPEGAVPVPKPRE